MRALLFIALTILCLNCSHKKPAKEPTTEVILDDTLKKEVDSTLKWFYLNDTPIPVISQIDQWVFESKQHYKQKSYSAASDKLDSVAKALLKVSEKRNKKEKLSDHKEILNSAKALITIANRLKQNQEVKEPELDSTLRKVCDVSMKHCWILSKYQDDDDWILEEEFRKHADSSYNYFLKKDTFRITDELLKSAVLLDIKKETGSSKTRILFGKASDDLKMIAHKIHSKKEVTDPHIKMVIAKSYYDIAFNDYHEALCELDSTHHQKRLGRTIKACSVYLEKALDMANIIPTDEEMSIFEDAELAGEELSLGISHPITDIQGTLNGLNNILSKYQSDFTTVEI